MAFRPQVGHQTALKLSFMFVMALLAACSTTPPPIWQSEAFDALELFRQHYFAGEVRNAERELASARSAVAATGRLELAARTELIRCAYGVAALDFDACAGFESFRGDAEKEDLAFAGFLIGSLETSNIGKLPPAYRDLASATDDKRRIRELQKIKDPVSRLIAAGVLFRRAQLAPEGFTAVIDTASMQGFRRPLLAWLKVELKRAEAAGDTAAIETIRRRIALAEGKP